MKSNVSRIHPKLAIWLCILAMSIAAVAVLVRFGVSVWTLILAAVFLACPFALAWAYFTGSRPLPIPLGPEPHTRGDTRYFNWITPWYDVQCSILGFGKSFREWTLALAKLRRGDHVLDVGCGNGVLTRRMAAIVGPGGEVWGIDPAPNMIRAAMEDAGRMGSAAHFKLAAVENLPFADQIFDVAVISLVLHHMPPDLKESGLKEVYRILKPEGRLLVVEPHRPDHWLLRTIYWPMRFYPKLKDHLEGRTPDIIRAGGFAPPTQLGWWRRSIAFWSGWKPVEEPREGALFSGCDKRSRSSGDHLGARHALEARADSHARQTQGKNRK